MWTTIMIIIMIWGLYLMYLGDRSVKLAPIVIGMCVITLSTLFLMVLYSIESTKQFKPEYQIELLNQDDIIINNGKELDTISFEYLEEYIEHDNL